MTSQSTTTPWPPIARLWPPAQGQGQDLDIDVEGEPAIEAHLFFGIASPSFSSREIKAVAAQRLLELVDVPIGQKYPGEMRFDRFDPGRLLGIDLR